MVGVITNCFSNNNTHIFLDNRKEGIWDNYLAYKHTAGCDSFFKLTDNAISVRLIQSFSAVSTAGNEGRKRPPPSPKVGECLYKLFS